MCYFTLLCLSYSLSLHFLRTWFRGSNNLCHPGCSCSIPHPYYKTLHITDRILHRAFLPDTFQFTPARAFKEEHYTFFRSSAFLPKWGVGANIGRYVCTCVGGRLLGWGILPSSETIKVHWSLFRVYSYNTGHCQFF